LQYAVGIFSDKTQVVVAESKEFIQKDAATIHFSKSNYKFPQIVVAIQNNDLV